MAFLASNCAKTFTVLIMARNVESWKLFERLNLRPRQLKGLDAGWWRTVGWFSRIRPKTKFYLEEAQAVKDAAEELEN